jgi:hypothetical protein
VRVHVVRRGGLAGIPLRGELETSELTANQAAPAEAALQGLAVGKPPAPPSHPDGFQYQLTFSGADGAARTVTIDEAEVSDALRPVIEMAASRGTLG